MRAARVAGTKTLMIPCRRQTVILRRPSRGEMKGQKANSAPVSQFTVEIVMRELSRAARLHPAVPSETSRIDSSRKA